MTHEELKDKVKRMLLTCTTYEMLDVIYNYIMQWSKLNPHVDIHDVWSITSEKERELDSANYSSDKYC